MKTDIELGDEVKDIYTGFTGIVMARTDFINGCIQFTVVSKWDKKATSPVDGLMPELNVDSQSLKVVKRGKIYKDKQKQLEDDEEPTGGPSTKAMRQRGY